VIAVTKTAYCSTYATYFSFTATLYRHLFEKIPITLVNCNYNISKLPYDYLSLLHPPYDWFTFGKYTKQTPVFSNGAIKTKSGDRFWTIKTKDPAYQYDIGQRKIFSYYDQRRINFAYHCPYDVNLDWINCKCYSRVKPF